MSNLSAIFEQLDPARMAAAIERATVYPYVVTALWRNADSSIGGTREVLQRGRHEAPTAEAVLPVGAVFLSGKVTPAEAFDSMETLFEREQHRAEYGTFRLWRTLHAAGKSVDSAVPWVDYDPVYVDECVRRWMRGSAQ